MLHWIPPETAPRDGTMIIGHFEDTHPERLVCMWNEADGEWVAAYPQSDVSQGSEDRYFDNERFHADDLKAWSEL